MQTKIISSPTSDLIAIVPVVVDSSHVSEENSTESGNETGTPYSSPPEDLPTCMDLVIFAGRDVRGGNFRGAFGGSRTGYFLANAALSGGMVSQGGLHLLGFGTGDRKPRILRLDCMNMTLYKENRVLDWLCTGIGVIGFVLTWVGIAEADNGIIIIGESIYAGRMTLLTATNQYAIKGLDRHLGHIGTTLEDDKVADLKKIIRSLKIECITNFGHILVHASIAVLSHMDLIDFDGLIEGVSPRLNHLIIGMFFLLPHVLLDLPSTCDMGKAGLKGSVKRRRPISRNPTRKGRLREGIGQWLETHGKA